MKRTSLFILLSWALGAAWGCAAKSGFLIISEDQPPTTIEASFETGIYRIDGDDELTVLLYDGPAEQPSQAMVIRMLWSPRAARTPVDPDATNATIRYVVFSGMEKGQIGIYEGAGYLYPVGRVGRGRLEFGLWQANLRWADSGEDYVDHIGRARVTGRFTVRRDDHSMSQVLRQLNVLITRRLGYPRFARSIVDSR